MTKKSLTVLLIEDNPEYAQLVQRWLSSKDDDEFVLSRAGSLAAGLDRLDQGDISAILLDLGLPDSRGIETFTRTKARATGVPILVLSGSDAEPLALQAIQQGAQDYYIVKSTCDGDLLVKALRHAIGRASQEVAEHLAADQGSVIGVMGAKGGVGTTTLACNLAIELRRQTDQGTLLANLDVSAGLISLLMRSDAEASMLDAMASMDRLNRTLWNGTVAHGPDGVDIMSSPYFLGIDKADAGKIADALALIRTFYRWTILDLGRAASGSLALLDKLSELFLVTTLSVPALHQTKRTVGVLLGAGLNPGRLRLIVNEVGAEEFSGSELERIFGVPVFAKLPGAARELDLACIEGQGLGARSDYRRRIASMARKIAGLPEETPAGSVAPLLRLVGTFRRMTKDLAAVARP